jgi:type IV pilus assembly protein PilC
MDGFQVMAAIRPRNLTDADVAAWAREMAALLGAGIPILQSLATMRRHAPHPALREASADIDLSVRGGKRLSEAMQDAKVFPALLVRLVAAGEAGGTLESFLGRAADGLESRYWLRRKVIAALTYPALTMAVLIVVAAVVVFFVLPAFGAMYAGAGMDLPWPTRLLLWSAEAARWLTLPAIAVMGIAVVAFARMSGGNSAQALLWELAWRAPIAGPVVRTAASAQAWRTFAILYGAGLVATEALEMTARAAGAGRVEAAFMRMRDAVLQGRSFTDAVQSEAHTFPPLTVEMASVGAESGRLEETVLAACTHLDRQTAHAVERLGSIIEPVLVIFAGAVALLVALGVYMPIFDLWRAVGGGR